MPPSRGSRRAQSGASQVFLAMSIFCWVSGSLIASFPVAMMHIFVVASWLLAVASLLVWAYSCARKSLS
jgi:hypothetical protein